jgi:NMD protein affecting ribosome stability and mRNA decay
MPRYGEKRTIQINGKPILMFIEYSGPRVKPGKCVVCGFPSEYLCDWILASRAGKAITCDRPLCQRCKRKPIPTFGKPETADIDYCPEHYAMYKAQMWEIKKDGPGDL